MNTTEMNVAQLRKRASELNIKNAKKYKKDQLIQIILIQEEELKSKKVEKKPRKKRVPLTQPQGLQSVAIYNMMTEHPSWSHYKISKMLECTYTNVRRVWLNYVKDRFEDKRVARVKKNID